MEIQKQLEQGVVPGSPGEEDLALINRFSRKELTADEVYVFRVTLCDNEIDRDGERFPTESLRALKDLFPGKTGLFDHSGKSGDQVMRIYAANLQEDPGRSTRPGEPYAALCARVYLLRSDENAALIRAIDAGIKKEVSISCAVKRVVCSVCGKAWGACEHKKGEPYSAKPCHAVLQEPTDAYEFSFVAVPAQPAAGVMKKKQETRSKRQEALYAEYDSLIEDGRTLRRELLEKALRAGALALPGMDRTLLESMCRPLPADDLRTLCATFERHAAKSLPLKPQLLGAASADAGNEGFRV